MQFFSLALPLALAGSALANPLLRRDDCAPGECLAAVTGKAALGDDGLRADHCKSFLATTVTPEAITTTVTITGIETTTPGWDKWKREKVTVCPNEVPNYASACDESAYSSACSCFGYSGDSTTTLKPTTTTKTVYISPSGTCSGAVATTTITVTVSGIPYGTPSGSPTTSPAGTSIIYGSGTTTIVVTTCPASSTTTVFGSVTTTVVVGSTTTTTVIATPTTCPVAECPSGTTTTVSGTTTTVASTTTTETVTSVTTTCPITSTTDTTTTTVTETTTTTTSSEIEAPTCLSQDQVDYFVDAFTNFLENTDATPYTAPFDADLARKVFTSDFQDQSDSINYLAGVPLGVTIFPNVEAFIAGQGSQYPVGVTTLNTWVGCTFFSWRYELKTGLGEDRPIQGINVFEVTDDLSQIKQNYAEFDNAAWQQNIAEYKSQLAAAAAAATTTTTSEVAAATTTSATTTTSGSPP